MHPAAPLRAAGIHLDISARKALEAVATQAQQALLEKQQALNEAQALAHLGSWEWNLESGSLHWSDEQFHIFGFDQDHTRPSYEIFLEALHPDDRNRVREAVNASLHHDAPYDLKCRIIRPEGEIGHIHCRGVIRRDVTGRPLTMIGTVLDITDYERTESALRNSEGKIRSIFESAIEGIIVIDDHGRIENVNPAMLALLRYEEQDLLGQNIKILMPSPYRDQHDDFLASYLITGKRSIIGSSREVQALRKDGTLVDVHLSVSELVIGHSRKYTGMLRDISGRKRLERDLQESEERFRQLADHIDAVFWLTSADKHQMLYISPAFETIWGRSRDDLYADPSCGSSAFTRMTVNGSPSRQPAKPIFPMTRNTGSSLPTGTVRWIRDRGFPVKDQDGTVYRLAGIAVDITAAKQLEIALRGRRLRYRSLVELSPNAVFVNCDGRMEFANQSCASLLGAMTVSQLPGAAAIRTSFIGMRVHSSRNAGRIESATEGRDALNRGASFTVWTEASILRKCRRAYSIRGKDRHACDSDRCDRAQTFGTRPAVHQCATDGYSQCRQASLDHRDRYDGHHHDLQCRGGSAAGIFGRRDDRQTFSRYVAHSSRN